MSTSTEIVAVGWTHDQVIAAYHKQVAMDYFATKNELVEQLHLRTLLPVRVIELALDRESFNQSVRVEVFELSDIA